MPSFKEHCKECQEELGNDFAHVHRWLDEHAAKYWPWMGHRAIRHHKDGIELVREQWGDEAAYAAELHILADMRQVGIYDSKVPSKKEVERLYGIQESLPDDVTDPGLSLANETDIRNMIAINSILDAEQNVDEIAEKNWRERYGDK